MKTQEDSILGPFWALFCPFWANNDFSVKFISATWFLGFYRCAKFKKKTNERIPRKIGYSHIVRQTVKHGFMGQLLSKVQLNNTFDMKQ